MRLIIFYLFSWLVAIAYLWSIELRGLLPHWLEGASLILRCALIGALGGTIYCLRSVYLSVSVRREWGEEWTVWYYLRPFVSLVIGGVSYLFLNAGLLALDANQEASPTPYGYLALAFVAGLNVDRFLLRVEQIAQSNWGLRPSRSSERSAKGDQS